jgi:hypothetical protein
VDGLIIEERYSFKKDKTKTIQQNFYKIEILEDGVWGEKLHKTQVKEQSRIKQEAIIEEIKDLFERNGELYCIGIFSKVLKQKRLQDKQVGKVFL